MIIRYSFRSAKLNAYEKCDDFGQQTLPVAASFLKSPMIRWLRIGPILLVMPAIFSVECLYISQKKTEPYHFFLEM